MNKRRSVATIIIAVSLVMICLVTLTPAPFSYRSHTLRVAFDFSTTHLREDALNALLFGPLGLGAALRQRSALWTLLFTAGISIAIEILQWNVVSGRFAETQDVVANSAGAMAAWYLARRIAGSKK